MVLLGHLGAKCIISQAHLPFFKVCLHYSSCPSLSQKCPSTLSFEILTTLRSPNDTPSGTATKLPWWPWTKSFTTSLAFHPLTWHPHGSWSCRCQHDTAIILREKSRSSTSLHSCNHHCSVLPLEVRVLAQALECTKWLPPKYHFILASTLQNRHNHDSLILYGESESKT